MSDVNALLGIVKKAAIEAVEQTQPTRLVYGTVLSTSPLKVKIGQKQPLESFFLKRLANVTVTSGMRVAMIQQQGGQSFLILGEVV